MLKFIDSSENVNGDALLILVDCVGHFPRSRIANIVGDDVQAAYRREFDAGCWEPGHVTSFTRAAGRPRHVLLMAAQVHSAGPIRDGYLRAGFESVLENVLQLGARSVILRRDSPFDEQEWQEIKLQLLASFARVPGIELLIPPPDLDVAPRKQVTIFSDGGCQPNPGPGAYGVVLRFGDNCKELSAAFEQTSSNRMELLGAIAGLEQLKEPCLVRLHTDSGYVVECVERGLLFRKAIQQWKDWGSNNVDLWKRFLEEVVRHDVEMVWVKGHAGVADNERCDALVNKALRSGRREIDLGFAGKKRRSKAGKKLAKSSKDSNKSRSPDPLVESVDSPPGKRGPKPKKVGDRCRHCSTPLVRRDTQRHRADAAYWYEWYLFCETCGRMYHVEEAKVIRK